MTKKEMIEIMQRREAQANKRLEHVKNQYGYGNENTDNFLWAWSEIYSLMDELGIATNRRGA